MRILRLMLLAIFPLTMIVKAQPKSNLDEDYPKAYVDFAAYKNLMLEVENHRASRLIGLNEFLKMSQQENVVILDTRADKRYERKHIKGAIHLTFTEFAQENLQQLIPNPNTVILIYCNNNFDGDQVDFISKIARPQNVSMNENDKELMMALNIPTYINLYGYGYKNIYELNELVNVNDPRIEFEGTEVNIN